MDDRENIPDSTLGTGINLKNKLPFSLSCSASKGGSKWRVDILITCDKNGEWRGEYALKEAEASDDVDRPGHRGKTADEYLRTPDSSDSTGPAYHQSIEAPPPEPGSSSE